MPREIRGINGKMLQYQTKGGTPAEQGGHRRNKGRGHRRKRGGHRRNTKSINKPINFAFVAETAQNEHPKNILH